MAEEAVRKKVKGDWKETAMKALFIVAAAAFIAALLVICAFIFVQSVPALKEVGVFKFLFSSKWNPGKGEFGIATMIVGSC